MDSQEKIISLDDNSNPSSFINEFITSNKEEEGFIVLDLEVLVKKFKEWKRLLPRVEPFYAIKCNDNYQILKTLNNLGIGFDCASKSEMSKVLKMVVNTNRIIYSHPTKSPLNIRHAKDSNIDLIVFDNEFELHKMKELFPNARLILRFDYNNEETEIRKFGCNPKTEAAKLFKIARDLNLNIVGVTFHLGCDMEKVPNIISNCIKTSRDLFDMAQTFGYSLNLLDLGGGFPGHDYDVFAKLAQEVNYSLDKYFPGNVKVIAEPGRFFAAPCCTILTKIHSKKTVTKPDNSQHNLYYISNGFYGNFMVYIRYKMAIMVQPYFPSTSNKLLESSIWGPTCDLGDQIIDKIMLPDLNISDWLVFKNIGAYSLSFPCPFNGFQPFHLYTVARKSFWEKLQ